jgi:hypothetical protein
MDLIFSFILKSRFLLVCLVWFSFPTVVYSQIMAGPKLGINLSSVDYRDSKYYDGFNVLPVPGFNVGGVANIRVNDIFSLQTEIFYSREGKAIYGINKDFQNHLATYHFLRFPILFRYTLNAPAFNSRFYVNIGPNISRWLGGSGSVKALDFQDVFQDSRLEYIIRFSPGDLTYDKVDLFMESPIKWHLGMDFGGGYIYDLSKKHKFFIDFRYLYGHSFYGRDTDITFTLEDYSDTFQSSPQVFSVSFGYIYDIDLFAWAKGKSTLKVK